MVMASGGLPSACYVFVLEGWCVSFWSVPVCVCAPYSLLPFDIS